MFKWYAFNKSIEENIYSPENYILSGDRKPACEGACKLCAILAEDNGKGQPHINHKILTEAFIQALLSKEDYGIVALNKKYKKKKNWLTIIFDELIG